MSSLTHLREVEKWLSPSEAGRVVGVSGQYMTVLAREKRVNALKTSLGWLFDPEDVLAFARRRNTLKDARKALA